jgi:hypothetical protein
LYLGEAARFWEPRRVGYNFVLTAVVVAWVIVTWPHFRPAFAWSSVLLLGFLAIVANVCYCAAYFVDVPMQEWAAAAWRGWRWGLWVAGTLFAILLANYWIADEIYPFVRAGK